MRSLDSPHEVALSHTRFNLVRLVRISWRKMMNLTKIAFAAAGLILGALLGLGVGWLLFSPDDNAEPEPLSVTAPANIEDDVGVLEGAVPQQAAPEDEYTEEEVTSSSQTVVVSSTPESIELPDPEPEIEEAAADPEPEPVMADPTGCTFQNGNRPKVGEKFVLSCDQGTFLAKGAYNFGTYGFDFSEFEPRTP